MRFWDSSAVVPLLVDEQSSSAVFELMAADPGPTVWWGTRVECASAIRRRERDGTLPSVGLATALDLLEELALTWAEILPGAAVRAGAERGVAVHPLSTAGSFQLSAAIVWRGADASPAEFVCLDDRLRDAAGREGFRLLPA